MTEQQKATTADELLPCPFCGSEELVRSTDLRSGDYDVLCTQCGAQAPSSAWLGARNSCENRRATPQPADEDTIDRCDHGEKFDADCRECQRYYPRSDAAPMAQEVSDDLVHHMVRRFLSWRLPKPWNPDNGISYARPNYAHPPADHDWPVGTNLFDAAEAEAMVLYMLEGFGTPQQASIATKPAGASVVAVHRKAYETVCSALGHIRVGVDDPKEFAAAALRIAARIESGALEIKGIAASSDTPASAAAEPIWYRAGMFTDAFNQIRVGHLT